MITIHALTASRLCALISEAGRLATSQDHSEEHPSWTLPDGSTILVVYHLDRIVVRASDYDTQALELCQDYLDDPDSGLVWSI